MLARRFGFLAGPPKADWSEKSKRSAAGVAGVAGVVLLNAGKMANDKYTKSRWNDPRYPRYPRQSTREMAVAPTSLVFKYR